MEPGTREHTIELVEPENTRDLYSNTFYGALFCTYNFVQLKRLRSRVSSPTKNRKRAETEGEVVVQR